MSKEFSAEFELWVANYYKSKVESCKDRGIEFKLSLISVRNLLSAKYCGYTGMELTRNKIGAKSAIQSDVTIDRIDNSLGYVKGNVIAVSNVANNFKSIFENPIYKMDMRMAEKALNKMQKRLKSVKEKKKMKLTDLLAILAFLITTFVGGYAWTEYQKSVTGQQDIRKNVVQKDLTEKERKCKLSFECSSKRTE